VNDRFNYFNYFTEIEEHFLRRRAGGLLLSTLDWALIETWKDAGIPLDAALRGIDAAFDRYDQRPSKTKKINSLAYCSQTVLAAAEDMKEAAVGAAEGGASLKAGSGQGFEPETIAAFLRRNAEILASAKLAKRNGVSFQTVVTEASQTLRTLAENVESENLRLEDLERRLTVVEEKMFAALLAATADEEIVTVRAEADRDLAPYRRKMSSAQIEQLQKQYVHKRLLEKYGLPRLSLFYM
jgi:HD-GYP domain-containing protein (c-di-GMP phosphodiesterase class II)